MAWPARDALRAWVSSVRSACTQHGLTLRLVGAACQPFHPGQNLCESVRLRQVVVTAGMEPCHPIGGVRDGAQHQDRGCNPLLAQLRHQGNPIQAWQAPIHDEDVINPLQCKRQAHLAIGRSIGNMTAFRQAADQIASPAVVIFHYE